MTRCAFPGEACEARATGYMVGNGVRVPICTHHVEVVKAHLAAMKRGEQMPNGPMHPRVVEARSMLRAHVTACKTCVKVEDELRRQLAARGETATTSEDEFAMGEFITAHACKIGYRLYFRLGAAMRALSPKQTAALAPSDV